LQISNEEAALTTTRSRHPYFPPARPSLFQVFSVKFPSRKKVAPIVRLLVEEKVPGSLRLPSASALLLVQFGSVRAFIFFSWVPVIPPPLPLRDPLLEKANLLLVHPWEIALCAPELCLTLSLLTPIRKISRTGRPLPSPRRIRLYVLLLAPFAADAALQSLSYLTRTTHNLLSPTKTVISPPFDLGSDWVFHKRKWFSPRPNFVFRPKFSSARPWPSMC